MQIAETVSKREIVVARTVSVRENDRVPEHFLVSTFAEVAKQ
jgi:hypothetical protein